MDAPPPTAPRLGLGEAVAIWVLLAAIGVATFVTYTRLEPEVLYRTTHEGLAGGASRTLVYLNYPVALIAIGIVLLVVDRLLSAAPRLVAGLAAAATVLCALVAVPGVVDPQDLDARPVNALPALGVALVVGLFVWSLARGGLGSAGGRVLGDRLRLALAVVLLVASIPWLFAEVGFYAPWPFLAEDVPPGETIAAVHLGRHHGMDGVLFALTALALSRQLRRFRSRYLAAATSGYLALMLSYGIANAAQDFWLEQVVKRGWTTVEIPDVLRPAPTLAWLVIVLAAVAIELLWFRRHRTRSGLHAQGAGELRP